MFQQPYFNTFINNRYCSCRKVLQTLFRTLNFLSLSCSWAKGDPRLFVLVNRAALESPYVTAHIPEWIDLVFGYKQTGRWGERAVNLYHPFVSHFYPPYPSVFLPFMNIHLVQLRSNYFKIVKLSCINFIDLFHYISIRGVAHFFSQTYEDLLWGN